MKDGSEILTLVLKVEGALLTALCQTATTKLDPHARVLYSFKSETQPIWKETETVKKYCTCLRSHTSVLPCSYLCICQHKHLTLKETGCLLTVIC